MTILGWILSRLQKENNRIYYIGGSETLPPPLTPQEEARAMERLLQEDPLVKSELIEHNLRLVVYIARKFENTGVGTEDLVSIGTIGLIKAVDTFRSERGSRLATYAAKCIDNAILPRRREKRKNCLQSWKDWYILEIQRATGG